MDTLEFDKFKEKEEESDLKAQKHEYPFPIVMDRPNNLKMVKKHCLLSFVVKPNQLPVHISAAGSDRAIFQFFVSFTKIIPDSETFDRRFDGTSFSITTEIIKGVLDNMMKDPIKKSEVLEILGLASEKSRIGSKNTHRQTIGFALKDDQFQEKEAASPRIKIFSPRDKPSNLKDNSLKGTLQITPTFASGFSTVSNSKPVIKPSTNALLTATSIFSEDSEVIPYQYTSASMEGTGFPYDGSSSNRGFNTLASLEAGIDDFHLEKAVFRITIRVFSNSANVSLTASLSKKGGKRKTRLKDSELFSKQRPETNHLAVELAKESTQRVVKKMGQTVFNLRFGAGLQGHQGHFTDSARKLDRVQSNKLIARSYLKHRMDHYKELSYQNSENVMNHTERARKAKMLVRRETIDKILYCEDRRLTERSERLERERQMQILPGMYKWITIIRMFGLLRVVEKKFNVKLAEVKRQRLLEKKARYIQNVWKMFRFRSAPIEKFGHKWKDARFATHYIAKQVRDSAQKHARQVASVFLRVYFDKLKLMKTFMMSLLHRKLLS